MAAQVEGSVDLNESQYSYFTVDTNAGTPGDTTMDTMSRPTTEVAPADVQVLADLEVEPAQGSVEPVTLHSRSASEQVQSATTDRGAEESK